MSKSGVFGLFGSKEQLQMATIDQARDVYMEVVVMPALSAEPGVEQLLALSRSYLEYSRNKVWPGGCFFRSVASELSEQPGPVRDRIAEEQRNWVGLLGYNAKRAIATGQLPDDDDALQVATELSVMLAGGDLSFQLHGDERILSRVLVGIQRRLGC